MKTLLFALCALLTLGFTLHAGEDVADITHEDLMKAIEAKTVTVIDVNGSESFAKSHITGAIDYQATTKDGSFASLLPADKSALIVAYCGGPACGAYMKAVKAAKELGYTNVVHYSAGLAGWNAAQKSAMADCPKCNGKGGEGKLCPHCAAM